VKIPNYEERKASEELLYSWEWNVRDHLKGKTKEEVRVILKETALPLTVMMCHCRGDYNFGSVIRTSNNFNLERVFYLGRKKYDKRFSRGVHHYTDVVFLSSMEEVIALKQQYRFVALENNTSRKTIPIQDYKWEKNSVIVVGEESRGIEPEILDMCDDYVEVPSMGSVRSLNVSVAASLAIYDYITKTRQI
jgi:tRNA (guanosine-2'-O-)-methyltransferase